VGLKLGRPVTSDIKQARLVMQNESKYSNDKKGARMFRFGTKIKICKSILDE
jgi:hypothetical protein